MADTQALASVEPAGTSNPISARKAGNFPTHQDRMGTSDVFVRGTRLTRSTTLIGRALFASIFLMSTVGHFRSATIGYAAHQGVPFAGFLVPASGLLALAGGLSVLLGYRTRLGAWLLVLFLVPVTVMMHNFWAVTDPVMRQLQMAMFMKNIALVGGALLISNTGAGPLGKARG